ncbi:cell division protein FtsH [Candidatus Daviesbacteria bacterium RIFCSPHIGHO2_01_FULL_44_29]|uniref:ATP-dependent zinc metalloprotease FtsH n=1 Tax=Candidatus Daviesbacteria bacterium RIFCSPHIGHO2_02_FULL_43_12 TaxID=1797776 RepID=A0A1F5KI34_9BACT|nr:MAG: cell division protein FtsH [Candidatus Daviesbacteria bacterium RIFCSPHIGHO2_01_FULL_44_29]OGE40572.1 MAG: cell division protein FtsH [Candidatus Daviesbacteria bacterium RIFCSPHIGHO2_02_FULL_43_12]OGE70132.1 MAG: cell division protein FtsH [Candidatus Daviesbacteria bacterium RIFCSPLOWO2_01_FULL_43_15]
MPNGKKRSSKDLNNPLVSFLKGAAVYVLIGLAALIFFANLSGSVEQSKEVPISKIIADIKEGKVDKLHVEGEKVIADYKDASSNATSRKEPGDSIYQILKNADVDSQSVQIEVKDLSWQQSWISILSGVLPIALMVVFFFMIFRQAKDGANGIFSFGQSRARVFSKDSPQVKFSDVAGVDEAKRELQEVVEFLKTPEKFKALGARIPKGVLMVGPSGVGKTLLARAVAGEAGVPFFSIAGSEFMEMLVGVGAARVRDMFAQAKKGAPAIIFIDEIESIGRARGMGMGGGHDEREQTLNQILVEMDGFSQNDLVIVIGATNRPDLLDPALVRPGRFDRRVTLNLPDLEERKRIIGLHMQGKPFTKEVSIEKLARRTSGFSGADLANMLNEAAILAARENKTAIDQIDLEEAATKEKLGPERRHLVSEADRKLSAYHEAGHAVVGHFLPHIDPVHRISIVSRGMSGGHTMFPPTEDRSNETRSRLIEQIAAALGGQAAEKLIFDDISTGASSDIKVATEVARAMVTEYGMSPIGPINLAPTMVFGAWRGSDNGGEMSPELHAVVDKEVRKLLDQGFSTALNVVKKHKAKLDKVAKKLLEVETLDGDQFAKIVGKKVVA